MRQISGDGMRKSSKCVVCGKRLAIRYIETDIDGKTPVAMWFHPWCKMAMIEGKKKPLAFWRAIGAAK